MTVCSVQVFCHACVQVHSIELDIEDALAERSGIADADVLEELPSNIGLVLEDAVRCPRTGRRLSLAREHNRLSFVLAHKGDGLVARYATDRVPGRHERTVMSIINCRASRTASWCHARYGHNRALAELV
jgi:hypothetical protein